MSFVVGLRPFRMSVDLSWPSAMAVKRLCSVEPSSRSITR